ncbi:MAG: response regulator transcription factor [Prevotella sp.]|jgi:DNA-binding NarL/FixJ family response regulator|nr:response regulator transcription factor [Prevotella sp.]MBR0269806.1 response regulator transcription factor [Prevotella sp.]MBR0527325.1 response regulator transcription factor [Prevotella sp.]
MEQSEKATLLIIEDHEIVALGLKTLIGSNPALSTVDCATNARQAIQLTVNHPYNLYIIDVELPDMTGIELVRSLKTLSPDSAFIFHTIHDELWTLRQMINSGANAIVMKSDDTSELLAAIGQVLEGNNYFSAHFRQACEEMEHYQTLSDREIEILRLIAEGLPSKDIAERLFVSQNTIEFHRKRIMRKLGVTNMAQLVKEGFAKGYIKVS